MKQRVKPSVRIWKMNVKYIVEWSFPIETKEETAHRVRAGDVGALGHSR
jgi:hypothetical protein